MKKQSFIVLLLTIVIAFSLCACGGKSTTVKITNDNWEEYFEVVIEPLELTKNGFGVIGSGHSAAYLVLKEEYKFDAKATSLTTKFKVSNECRFAEIKDNKVEIGNIYESRGTETYEDETNIDSEKVMLSASYPYGTTPDGQDFWAIIKSCEISHIEGTLSLLS